MFSNHLTIFERVSSFDKNLTEDMVLSYAMELESMYICDTNVMSFYKDVPLTIDSTTKLALLPCNIFRVMEVYTSDGSHVEYNLTSKKSYIKIPNNTSGVFISYIGLPFDDEGNVLIANNHIPAHETYTKIKIKEIDHLNGNYDPNMYAMFNMQLSNQIVAIKQSAINLDVNKYDMLNVIRYNMVPNVHQQSLFHKRFG